MKLREIWPDLTFKDKVDIIGDIVTILVSLIALWGTFEAWQNGFWHKIKHIVDHYHAEVVEDEKNNKILPELFE